MRSAPAIAVVGTPTLAASASFSVATPSGVQVGDYLVAVVRAQGYRTQAQQFTASGWAQISDPNPGSDVNQRHLSIHGRAVPDAAALAALPASHTFSSSLASSARHLALILVVRGVDLNTPLAGRTALSYGLTPGTTGTPTADQAKSTLPAWDVTGPSLALFSAGVEYTANANVEPTVTPSGYAKLAFILSSTSSTVSRTAVWLGTRSVDAPSAPGGVLEWLNNSPSHAEIGVALLGADVAPPEPEWTPGRVVRTNIATEARGRSLTPTVGFRNSRWYGGSGNTGNYTTVSGASDGPLPELTTYIRKTWTVGQAGITGGDTGFDCVSSAFPVAPGETWYLWAYIRTTREQRPLYIRADMVDGAGAVISGLSNQRIERLDGSPVTTRMTAGVWTLFAGFVTIPTGRGVERLNLRVDSPGDSVNPWLTGDTLEGTGLYIGRERPLRFFDGETADDAGPGYVYDYTNGSLGPSTQRELVGRNDPRGVGVPAYLGDERTARWYVTDSQGRARTPAAVHPILPGFDSVADMLATPGFTWGHRGNSTRFPEMTSYAYAQTAVRRYGVLEFSLAMSSDGVYFGHHDTDMSRATGGVLTGPPSSYTWAQIQAALVTIGTINRPQPFMRWEEFVALYAKTHVIVADPKSLLSSTAGRTAFLDLITSTVAPERLIAKYFGGGSGAAAFADAASARGLATWGYYYQGDADDGTMDAWQSHWSILGMEHGATQAAWDKARSFGKPVVGHIAATQAQYDAAMAKGASGVQVSASHLVAAVGPYT